MSVLSFCYFVNLELQILIRECLINYIFYRNLLMLFSSFARESSDLKIWYFSVSYSPVKNLFLVHLGVEFLSENHIRLLFNVCLFSCQILKVNQSFLGSIWILKFNQHFSSRFPNIPLKQKVLFFFDCLHNFNVGLHDHTIVVVCASAEIFIEFSKIVSRIKTYYGFVSLVIVFRLTLFHFYVFELNKFIEELFKFFNADLWGKIF